MFDGGTKHGIVVARQPRHLVQNIFERFLFRTKNFFPPWAWEERRGPCRDWFRLLTVAALAFSTPLSAQTWPLPPRPAEAPGGGAFVQTIAPLPLAEREARLEREILRGNVPEFLRRLSPVTLRAGTNVAVIHVTPDYLAVGSDDDYFLAPLTPATAQRLADATGCVLPTRKMVDAIHAAAPLRLEPAPIPPSQAMTSVAVFAQHNAMVRTQRLARAAGHPAGTLVAGHKKDVVISNRLTNAPGKVAIYGWHRPGGQPIQPLYLGHTNSWVDYSHGVRLVQSALRLNGASNTVAALLADARLAPLLSDEGVIARPRYAAPRRADEVLTEFKPLPDVRVVMNSPPAEAFTANKIVRLVLYALPNGSTIEQTVGHRLRPGDDWHNDIQHIAAQTRWLRAADINAVWVVAYLEAAAKSWPAWRKQHTEDDAPIRRIIAALTARFTNRPVELILTGHSGGGSFAFGYLNSVEEIPDAVTRMAFLDSDYAYDLAPGHTAKLAGWIKSSDRHRLVVLAYDDANALLDGQPFVSATGGTWYRSHLMQTNLAAHFPFTRTDRDGLEVFTALEGRVQLLLKPNPDRKILHTVQVEKNGFIHAMLAGTPLEGMGYAYFGPRAYEPWIDE